MVIKITSVKWWERLRMACNMVDCAIGLIITGTLRIDVPFGAVAHATPNDPSSPTAKPNAPEQEAEKSRSVQRLVRLPVTPQHTHTELPALETPEIKFAPIRVPLALQNGPHWHRPEGIHSIQTEVWNLAWLLDKLGITDEQVVHSLRQISGYVSYLEGRSQPNDPSSPTAEPNVQSAATALSAVGCSGLLGGQKPNPSDWPHNQQIEINSSSSPTNISPDFESECSETAAVTPTDRMVLLERNLKAELARRKEVVKKKEMSAKLGSNKDNRGGLLGQWYRLRYSLRTFVGSWRAWDDAKLEWYLARNGPPNDQSSPTAEPNVQSAATALSAVGCSAWLGDGNPDLKSLEVVVDRALDSTRKMQPCLQWLVGHWNDRDESSQESGTFPLVSQTSQQATQ